MKKCPSCKIELQDDATICHSCKESFLIEEDEEIPEEEPVSFEAPERKKWLRTLFLSVVSIFSVLVLLFSWWGYSEDSLGAFFLIPVFVSSLVIAIIAGALLTYYEHFMAIGKRVEENNIGQYIKMAVIRLLLGGFFIYSRISMGGGFLGSDEGSADYIFGNNFGNFILWIIAILLVMDGLRNLYFVAREVMKGFMSDEDENWL